MALLLLLVLVLILIPFYGNTAPIQRLVEVFATPEDNDDCHSSPLTPGSPDYRGLFLIVLAFALGVCSPFIVGYLGSLGGR